MRNIYSFQTLCNTVERSGKKSFQGPQLLRMLLSILRFLWCLPTELLALFLLMLWRSDAADRGQIREAHVFLLPGPERRGLSLGRFIFVWSRKKPRLHDKEAWEDLLTHEYGHTVQALYLGPVYLIVIGLPSLIWAGLPHLRRMRRRRGISYYQLYTERWADSLGQKALRRPLYRL